MNSNISVPSRGEEVSALLRIAGPLIAAYLAEMAMFLITKMVVGRLGYEELAAVGLAGHLMLESLVITMGLLSVIGVFVAEAEGSGQRHRAGHATRQGAIIAVLLGVPLTIIVWNFAHILPYLGQEPTVVAYADEYLKTLSPSVLAILGFSVLRSFVAALSRTTPVMVITVLAVVLNYFLTIGLVLGEYGLPEMGVAGAGLANSLSLWVMLIALVAYVFFKSDLRGFGLFRDRLNVDGKMIGEIFRLGAPVALLVALEAGLFMSVSILSGVLGAKTLAAFEILMSWVSIPFFVSLGLAEAAMVRVAFGVGKNNMLAARQSGVIALVLSTILVAIMIIVPLGFPQLIVDFFLEKDDPGYADVSAMVIGLLYIVAIFQVFDGLQAVAARALRGIRDTIVPVWMAAVGYWVFGIAGGAALTFGLGWGAAGLWWGLAAGLIVTGSLLSWRFWKLTSRSILKSTQVGEPS